MATQQSFSFLVAFLIVFFASSLANAAQYNVLSYGAKPDGKTDSTKAFLVAWTEACRSIKPATVYVPAGRFFLRNIVFQGPCKNGAILFSIVGTLVAPSDYQVIGNDGYWLVFKHVNGVTVYGGVLDGQGSALWACKASGQNCPAGATSLRFSNSTNIAISGLTSLNSQKFHIVINDCHNVKLQSVKVSASGNSLNTDGIHVELSSAVTIFDSRIRTGDDCISVGPGTTNLRIERVECGPGHGISIGSLAKKFEEPGVENVTIKSVVLTETQNGLRIKSWARPSNGFVRNIRFQDAVMKNVRNPIVIDQHYCPGHKNCPGQESGIKISDVMYSGILGTSATQVAVNFNCSKTNPCTGIHLMDVNLTYGNQPSEASCKNAEGKATGFVQPSSCL